MKRLERFALATLSAALLIGAANSVSAGSVGINFAGRDSGGYQMLPHEVAGVVPQPNWNNIPGDPFSGTAVSLKDETGKFTDVTLVYLASDSWNSDTAVPLATPNHKLMKGIHKANPNPDPPTTPTGGTERMVFTLTNVPAGNYDVLVYNLHNGSGPQVAISIGTVTNYIAQSGSFDGTFVKATSTDPSNYESGPNYAEFKAVAAVNGGITIIARKNWEADTGDGIGVCAIQLVSAGTFPANTKPVTITSHPTGTLTVEGSPVSFTVGMGGNGNVQWQKNGANIPNATNLTYAFTAALADNNTKYRAVLYNNVNTNISDEATLLVDAKTPPQLVQGFLTVDRYEGIGNTLGQGGQDELKEIISTNRPPSRTFTIGGANLVQSSPGIDGFGARIWGWLRPDVTGDYDFFLRADDVVQLWINPAAAASGTNTLPNIMVDSPVAEEISGCCQPFQEVGALETTATPIRLEAGKLYGIVVLFKEGGGDDWAQLAWRLTTDTTAASALSPIPGQNLFTLASSAGTRSTINTQPQSQSVVEGKLAVFTANATTVPVAGNFAIQWLTNGVVVPGQTTTTFAIPGTTLAQNNLKVKARFLTLSGALETTEATLTVVPDTFAPVPQVGAIRNMENSVDVGIGFDEAVDPVTAGNLANYTLTGGTIVSTTFMTNSPSVVIRATGLNVGTDYTVTVRNVKDLKGNAIPAAGVTKPFQVDPAVKWGVVGPMPSELGNRFPAGQAVVAMGNGNFDVYSDGMGQWGSFDEATLVYEELTGDFDRKVQVEYQDNASQWSRAGLIVKEDTNFGVDRAAQEGGLASRYQKVHFNPTGPTQTGPGTGGNNNAEGNRRLAKGGATSSGGGGGGTPGYPNAWVRIQRVDQRINLFRSSDGVTWSAIGGTTFPDPSDDRPLPAKLYVGIDYAPENGNVAESTGLRGRWLAKFRNYGPVAAAPAQPTMTWQKTATGIRITYTGVLESTENLSNNSWAPVSNATSPYDANTSTGEKKFYRAKGQ